LLTLQWGKQRIRFHEEHQPHQVIRDTSDLETNDEEPKERKISGISL